jgi:hypothetical protein
MLKKLIARVIGLVESDYTLTWNGNRYVRLPQSLAVTPPLPDESPLRNDEFFETKQEAGLSIMDDDTHGFILVTLKKDGAMGNVDIHGHIPQSHQAAFHETLGRILVEGQKIADAQRRGIAKIERA